ncbi:MAG: L-fuconate dehydratase [Bacteroidota bacterium]
MNPDPDYSATYVILETDSPAGTEGHGLTFTIGRGNEICVKAIEALTPLVVGQNMQAIAQDMAAFWRHMVSDSQLRWLGPEKGVIHLATAAMVNAVWDLYAKLAGKPLWELIADLSPEELLRCIDFTYLTDVITPAEALEILLQQVPHKAERKAQLLRKGYPAYTTSAGWLGYDDAKVERLVREALAEGFQHFKMKVGANVADDQRRAAIIRRTIGPDRYLMMDANQKWDVPQAIEWMEQLRAYQPWWIEEPTSPDDILGHRAIREGLPGIGVATGEHAQNRLIFKQLLQAEAIDFCQIDSCRLGGVNEVLAVMLLAAKFNIPVCPHAGGVGLCEYVQHLSMIDYLCISGSTEGRVIEFVDHLHEHFIEPVHLQNAHYMPPKLPGYSIEMHPASLARYRFPDGEYWRTAHPAAVSPQSV